MIVALACSLFALAAAPEPPKAVGDALRTNAELARHHAGYLNYLAAHPAQRAAETAYLQLLIYDDFRAADAAFDEALVSDAEAERLSLQFYDQLARDPTMREAVERLQRTGLTLPGAAALNNQALDYLRANPELALNFLESAGGIAGLPSALQPFAEDLVANPDALGGLLEAYRGVYDQPLAQTNAFPWWSRLARLDAASGGAYGRLAQQFAAHPNRFWAWHQRQLALAEDAQGRAWIQWWHRRVRREPRLGEEYWRYMRALLPEEGVWDKSHPTEEQTPAAVDRREVWPPAYAPPRLKALDAHGGSNTQSTTTGDPARVTAPARPTVDRPTVARPTPPEAPVAPEQPEGARIPRPPRKPLPARD